MKVTRIEHLDDPRLTDYRAIKDRQWLAEFQPGGLPDPAAPHGKFMAEGELVVRQLLRSAFPTLSVLLTPTRLAAMETELAELPVETPVFVIDQHQMNEVIGYPLHRGILAIAARAPSRSVSDLLALVANRPGPLVVMEDLTNHDNIGSIFRSAACLGAAGVLLSPRCADPLYRKAVRVSVGHILHVPFAVAPDWPGPLDELVRRGWQLAVLTPEPESVNIRDLPSGESSGGRTALLVGTEGRGVSLEALKRASVRLRIGMVGGVDSLNVAVTAGIALHRIGHL